MDNLESVRWELHDRTTSHERLGQNMRLEAELACSKPAPRTQHTIFSLLIGIASILVWLMVR
jgi:hypothetical protein